MNVGSLSFVRIIVRPDFIPAQHASTLSISINSKHGKVCQIELNLDSLF
jgi:hypothetical protein